MLTMVNQYLLPSVTVSCADHMLVSWTCSFEVFFYLCNLIKHVKASWTHSLLPPCVRTFSDPTHGP